MIVLIAKNKVNKSNLEEFLSLAQIMVENTRKEAGCLYYDFVQDKADESLYYFVEKYVDQAAVDAHNNSSYFQTYIPRIRELRDDTSLTSCDVVF